MGAKMPKFTENLYLWQAKWTEKAFDPAPGA
jgi:hypothetical protein